MIIYSIVLLKKQWSENIVYFRFNSYIRNRIKKNRCRENKNTSILNAVITTLYRTNLLR